MELFDNTIPLKDKRITAEACVHHLWFSDKDYDEKGMFIKWNPAVKSQADQDAVWAALNDDRIDILATDHAPHTLEEKDNNYFNVPSGGPLVQHAVLAILQKVKEGKISLERAVEKMSHSKISGQKSEKISGKKIPQLAGTKNLRKSEKI